jgi:uncharacterized C2H2 Zn-finger protein
MGKSKATVYRYRKVNTMRSPSTIHPNTNIHLVFCIQPDPPQHPDPADGLHHPIEYHDPTGPVQADTTDSIPPDSSPLPQFEISTQARVSVLKEVCHCEHPFQNGTTCQKVFGRYTELKRHINTVHTHKRSRLCPHCPFEQWFSRQDTLKRHIRRAHPEEST